MSDGYYKEIYKPPAKNSVLDDITVIGAKGIYLPNV